MRLDKYLADANLGTRSEVKNFIKKKLVFIDDCCVTNPGAQVLETSKVVCNGVPIILKKNCYYMFHKPAGCVSATKDIDKTVLDYFDQSAGKNLFPVGRLDKDTEGLLLITNDGLFSHQLMNPKKHVTKLYYFEGQGQFIKNTLEKMETGLDIGDEKITKPAKILYCTKEKSEKIIGNLDLSFSTCLENESKKHTMDTDVYGLLEITEGRFHQVKRMLKKCGVQVLYLKRIAIGALFLDDTLNCGAYRCLEKEDFNKLGINKES